MGTQRAVLCHMPHLRNDRPAAIVRGKRHLHRAQIGAFGLETKIAALVADRRADDCNVRAKRGEVKPVLALEFHALDDGFGGSRFIHGAAFLVGVHERVHADLCKNPGAMPGSFPQHVEDDARRKVVRLHLVRGDHLPDERRIGTRRARRIAAAYDLRQASGLRDMVHALDAEHVAGRDGMNRRQVLRRPFGFESFAQRLKHHVGAAQPA